MDIKIHPHMNRYILRYILISSKWFPELEATGSWLLGPQGKGESFPVERRPKASSSISKSLGSKGTFLKASPRKRNRGAAELD